MNRINENIWIGGIHDAMTVRGITDLPIDVRERLQLDSSNHVDTNELIKISESINFCVTEGLRVLVHCTQGQERSPLAVAVYLVLYKGYTFDSAYDLIKEKRPQVEDRRDWIKLKELRER